MDPEVIHIPELAQLLSRSEASIRSARQANAAWLPPSFLQGGRVCWRVATVRKFLEEWEAGIHTPAKPGRKRRTPPTLTSIR
ncbi:hypothetical protein VA602_18185 [Pseudomonas sp. MH2]|uniref:Helix-turn-helix domain-containing protein n=1 Tax=Pseudomonas machongensis TaxID=3110229 RepID=A0ABU5VIQ2_9PSED|nr:hypothetical protein [Pseudomonas sp. MH2]MEA5673254.1 hypothetical protein [Pseudomonas sp. MH2]